MEWSYSSRQMQGLTQISPSPGVIPGARLLPKSRSPAPPVSPWPAGLFIACDKVNAPTAAPKGNPMFELSMPVWEYVLRAVVVYVVLLGMIRLSGKRTMGQFTPFD